MEFLQYKQTFQYQSGTGLWMNVLIGKFPYNSLHKSNWGLTILVYLLPLLKAFDPLECLPDKVLPNNKILKRLP